MSLAVRLDSEARALRKDVLVRRSIHGLIALAPLYYLLPDDLPIIGLRRWVLLIAFFAGIAAVEAYRLKKGLTFLGLRPHEAHNIASFVWAAAGITAVLWLFPYDVATATLVGLAFVDPIAGELRAAGKREMIALQLSAGAYFVLCSAILLLWGWRGIALSLIMGVAGAVVAVLSERYKNPYVDDDFVMAVFPAAVMSWLARLL
ncbi:MAG: hypothetical protein ACUVT7_00835 [Thermoplasmata archaeon]